MYTVLIKLYLTENKVAKNFELHICTDWVRKIISGYQ